MSSKALKQNYYNSTIVYRRGKIMSQRANKLQRPFLANSIFCSEPISKMSKTAARHEKTVAGNKTCAQSRICEIKVLHVGNSKFKTRMKYCSFLA